MISLNKVILIGRLGKDPEIKDFTSFKIYKLSLATSESYKDKETGERKEITEWHNIVIYNENIFNMIERYLTKGDMVYIEGTLKTRKWEDKLGAKQYKTEVILQRNGVLKILQNKKPAIEIAEVSKSSSLEDDDIPF